MLSAPSVERLIAELDDAVESHLDWTRRVLRCAVLRTLPDPDILAVDAHMRCRFGGWFSQNQQAFEQLEAAATAQVLEQHEAMHKAIRRLCTALLDHVAAAEALDAFESSQSGLIAGLARLKTQVLQRSARHDPLTGLPLRYGLADEFKHFRSLVARTGHQLVLLLADVDHFKDVNDSHGHGVGDLALRHIADVLRSQMRADETIFRFGGEEFLLLMHAETKAAAGQAAERLLKALRSRPLVLPSGVTLNLRISAGLAVAAPGDSIEKTVERADVALYVAKRGGRDRWQWDETAAAG